MFLKLVRQISPSNYTHMHICTDGATPVLCNELVIEGNLILWTALILCLATSTKLCS